MKLYSCKAVESFLSDLAACNYEIITLREGVLGCGDMVAIAPCKAASNFVIREVYLNPWSSAHTIQRRAKISKALWKEIDAAQSALDEGAA